MSQLFIANYLEVLLQFWEDHNLCGEFNLQIKEKHLKGGGGPVKDGRYLALIGSELNNVGYLAKPIDDYYMLRKVLTGTTYTHKNDFQPRIPKTLREHFPEGSKDFGAHHFVKPPLRISKYLLAWNQTRRACIVDESITVPRLKLNEEEWLSCLAYPAFYLRLSTSLTYYDFVLEAETPLSNLLIYEEDDAINILAWPDYLEEKCYSPEERRRIINGAIDLKKNKKIDPQIAVDTGKVYKWFMVPLSIKKGTSLVKQVTGGTPSVEYIELYDPSLWVFPGDKLLSGEHYAIQYENFLKLVETVNGFCKLIASLPPAPPVKVIEGDHSHPTHQPPKQWFELPQQVVESFKRSKEDKTVIIRTCGGEMPAHLRRGHYREYKSGLRIWIDSFTVRKDKLEKEQLQGGALKIK